MNTAARLIRKHLAILALCSPALMSTSAYADPTNFNYTSVGGGLIKVHYKTPICVSNVCYSDLGGFSAGGSFQFANGWLVLSGDVSGAANSGYGTSIAAGGSSLGISVVKALGDRVDVNAGIASLGASAEVCAGTCVKATDSGMSYSAGLGVWFDDARRFAGSLGVSSFKYSNSSSTTSTGLGFSYYITKNHAITLAYSSTDTASVTGIGYTYHFNTGSN